jgi:hypothetical protein
MVVKPSTPECDEGLLPPEARNGRHERAKMRGVARATDAAPHSRRYLGKLVTFLRDRYAFANALLNTGRSLHKGSPNHQIAGVDRAARRAKEPREIVD